MFDEGKILGNYLNLCDAVDRACDQLPAINRDDVAAGYVVNQVMRASLSSLRLLYLLRIRVSGEMLTSLADAVKAIDYQLAVEANKRQATGERRGR